MILLVPGDPLRPRRTDPHFVEEAEAARDLGVDVAVLPAGPLTGGPALYRGWMLTPSDYTTMVADLAVPPVTSPEAYRTAHELPGWYAALAEVTPRTVWTVGDSRAAFDEALDRFGDGPAVLRDYTKSMKHHWDEAVYIPSADRARAIAARFRELRDDDFTGGFVLREFEPFDGPEVRTWWRDGTCVLTGPHPDTPGEWPRDVDLSAVTPLVAALGLPFVTVDLARRTDGVWRVIELGDGQVSDRPRTIPADTFLTAIGLIP